MAVLALVCAGYVGWAIGQHQSPVVAVIGAGLLFIFGFGILGCAATLVGQWLDRR